MPANFVTQLRSDKVIRQPMVHMDRQSPHQVWDHHQSPDSTTDIVPAATVVVLRDNAEDMELLLLRRSAKVVFADMWVFPGGRIEEIDIVPGDELATAAQAATREAKEEPQLNLNPETLVWFSHWTPPAITPKRFSTFFFATGISTKNSMDIVVDQAEITDYVWLPPARALELRNA